MSYYKGSERCRSPLLYSPRLSVSLLVSVFTVQSSICPAFSFPSVPQQIHRQNSFLRSLSYTTACSAVNHEAVEVVLNQRDVNFGPVIPVQPMSRRPFQEVWELLGKALHHGNKELPSAEEALKILKAPMMAEYSDETEFNRAQFTALRHCLSEFEIPLTKHDNMIVLNLGETQESAVGIARQNSPANDLVDDITNLKTRTLECSYASTTIENSSTKQDVAPKTNHAVCLLRNYTNMWSATDCFSVVELKTSDTTCKSFQYDGVDGFMMKPDFSNRHAALGEVLLCNSGLVLHHQARRGVLGGSIPVTMIAARSNGYDQNWEVEKQDLRWVSATMHVPKACGGAFYYSVQDFDRFSNDDKDGSVEHAVTLYIETLLFGLTAAIKVQKKLAAGETPLALPASGQSLMIGNVVLDQLEFCSSPIPGAVTGSTCDDLTAVGNWTASQGDLFEGALDISEALKQANPTVVVDFRRGKKRNAGTHHVLAKVSSTVVHHLLVRPVEAYHALKEIKNHGKKSLLNEIGSVLYAAVRMGNNLVTIMDDLTQQGYEPLKPMSNSGDLDILWGGFQDLVVRALLPMAELGIVHANIRPGYDVTANIVAKLKRGKGGLTKATLKLVDLERLVYFEDLKVSYLDNNFVHGGPGLDATTYLWWQCMAIAYAWKENLNSSSISRGRIISHLKHMLLGDLPGPAWLEKYCDRARGKITADTLEMTLTELAGVLRK